MLTWFYADPMHNILLCAQGTACDLRNTKENAWRGAKASAHRTADEREAAEDRTQSAGNAFSRGYHGRNAARAFGRFAGIAIPSFRRRFRSFGTGAGS